MVDTNHKRISLTENENYGKINKETEEANKQNGFRKQEYSEKSTKEIGYEPKILNSTNYINQKISSVLQPIMKLTNNAYSSLMNTTYATPSFSKSKYNTFSAQRDLNQHGYTDFQGKKLSEDGVWGEKTNSAFSKALFHEQQMAAPNEDTKKLQTALNKYGFTDINGNKLKEDGVLGPLTDSATYSAIKNLNKKARDDVIKQGLSNKETTSTSDYKNEKTDTDITKSLLKKFSDNQLQKIKTNLNIPKYQDETYFSEMFNAFSEKTGLNFENTAHVLSTDDFEEYKNDVKTTNNLKPKGTPEKAVLVSQFDDMRWALSKFRLKKTWDIKTISDDCLAAAQAYAEKKN